MWALPSDLEYAKSNSTSLCDMKRRNLDTVAAVFPYLLTFCFMLMASVAFQLVAEERTKQLFAYLRRLGLHDSTYWISWTIVFQVLLLIACSIAMLVMAIVRLYSSALTDISFGMMFLLFWASGTGMVSNGMFLASINRYVSPYHLHVILYLARCSCVENSIAHVVIILRVCGGIGRLPLQQASYLATS
jgi:hypothetical protein